MFEFLFKYPASVFAKGKLVLLGQRPVWMLAAAIVVAALAFAYPIWKRRAQHAGGVVGLRPAAIWLLQTLFISLLLLVLWHPAVSVATLRPQQNVVAVVIDDSRSMALADDGKSRKDHLVEALNSGVLRDLQKKFQVRLYRAGAGLERIERLDQLNTSDTSTHLGESLKLVMGESSSLPVGAVVLLSDGADNSGGIDLNTMDEIRRQHIPLHTVGFGREQAMHDIEIGDAQLPPRTLAESRLSANVTFHQHGYAGEQARLSVKDGGKTIAFRVVTLKQDGIEQTETLAFNAGPAGAKVLQISIDPLQNEENVNNNSVTRLVGVDSAKPRILYVEGEPRWEYKFLRRAAELDNSLQLSSMLRTTQNKIYRQGIADPKELEDGFPTKVEDLFRYQGLIIGGVEANYFTSTQQTLIKEFVDRRGGGILFLAGRFGLADGGYAKSEFADLLPTILPDRKNTFHRDPATVQLTPAGRDSLLTRIEDDPGVNEARWKNLPYLANFEEPGTPKPGALVLAEMLPPGGKLPLLITQNYGRGRSALFATAGSWRWQMLQPLSDMSHEIFWRQMLRWVVGGTNGRVVATVAKTVLSDETRVHLRAEVRDKSYLPANDAKVQAHVMGPEGLAETVEMRPEPGSDGIYVADWNADKAGSYVAEVTATRVNEEPIGDVATFRREDGVAENFHTQQNRELLEKLSSQTGGRYYRPGQISKLADEISYSEAGINTRETKDLWDMPIVFLAALLLRSGEWLMRRRWGVV
jgi:uncharacterized membrane protein